MKYKNKIYKNKRMSALIVACFILSFACVLTWVYILISQMMVLICHYLSSNYNPELFSISVMVILLISIVINIKTQITQLSAGGRAIANRVQATEVTDSQLSYPYRRLRNLVEEISIACRLPMPGIYVMENEQGINAFAAGYTPSDAVIVVTNGALRLLNRNELQAVLAHEYSHILNGDMRLNIQLVAWLSGISVIGDMGYAIISYYKLFLMEFMQDRNNDAHSEDFRPLVLIFLLALFVPVAIFAAALIIMGLVGSILNNLLRALINRQREYIADLHAVSYLRLDVGLISALKKIAGIKPGSAIQRINTDGISHFFFSPPGSTHRIISSHPSIIKRITALDPSFTCEELERLKHGWGVKLPDGVNEDQVMGFASLLAADNNVNLNDDIRSPVTEFKRINSNYSKEISPSLRKYTHTADGVIPLVFALVLSDYQKTRLQQVSHLQEEYTVEVCKTTLKLYDENIKMNLVQRFHIALLCIIGLRKLQHSQLDMVAQTIDKLTSLDRDVSLSGYFTALYLKTEIADISAPASAIDASPATLQELSQDISQLIAVFARGYTISEVEGENAYNKFITQLFPTLKMPMPAVISSLKSLDAIWPKLKNLELNEKKHFVDALAILIYTNGSMSQSESELIYTVCRLLRVPMISEIKIN